MKRLLLLLLVIATAATCFSADKPNIVLVLADDFGWGDAACYGGPTSTPALDRLAKEGTRFTQFYVASPICSASRCGIITGQFPARWNITSYLQTRAGNRTCEQADFLDANAPSLPRVLKAAGYATAHIGKWHLGGGRDVVNPPKFAAYGYDLGLGTYESPEPAAPLGLKTAPWEVNREPQQVERSDRTRWMVDQTIDFLKSHRDQPCFVNLWTDDVHTPHRPSKEQLAEINGESDPPGRCHAVIAELDRQIGRLLDAIDALGIASNTLVIFTGDNGPEPAFGRERTGGLRGMKWSLYEGGIRTPLIVRWPGVIPAGHVDATSVLSTVDFFPTVCSLAGISLPEGFAGDGENVATAWRGEPRRERQPLFWEYGRKSAEGKGHGTFPYPGTPADKSPNVAVRDGNWKLLINADGSARALYDLAADPKETTDASATEKEVAARLTKSALAWRNALPKLEGKP